MIHITGTGAVNIPPCAGIRLTINTGFTGTFTLVDSAGVTQAVVTNPATGNSFLWMGLNSAGPTAATLTASATGDSTVSILSAMRA